MIKLVGLIKKRRDLSDAAFRSHWLEVHAKLAARLPSLQRYSINVIDRQVYPDSAYDGFSELWFDSREALDAAFASPAGQAITRDIPEFIGDLVRVLVDEREIVCTG